MNFLFPEHRALCMAENATHNLHNVLTLRGALVRDPHVWAALPRRGDRAVRRRRRRPLRPAPLAALGERADRRLPRQAARPLRLHPRPDAAPAEQGVRRQRDRRAARAAAEPRARVALPRLLRLAEPQRQGRLPALHGLVRRQPRAPLAAPAAGRRPSATWRSRAGPTRCSRNAREAFAAATSAGSPRSSTTSCSPTRRTARPASCRRGRSSSSAFGAENGTWRNFFLMGARELREGVAGTAASIPPDFIAQPLDRRSCSTRWRSRSTDRAPATLRLRMHWRFTDTGEEYALTLENGVLTHRRAARPGEVDATRDTSSAPRSTSCCSARRRPEELLARGRLSVEGDAAVARPAAGPARPARPALRDRHALRPCDR